MVEQSIYQVVAPFFFTHPYLVEILAQGTQGQPIFLRRALLLRCIVAVTRENIMLGLEVRWPVLHVRLTTATTILICALHALVDRHLAVELLHAQQV